MPIYEYECGSCGHRMEAIQKMSEPLLKDCPQCGAAALRKLMSAAGFQLKGTGWYATDFKGGGKNKGGAEKEGSKKEDSKQKSDKKVSSSDVPSPPPKKQAGSCGGGACGCH